MYSYQKVLNGQWKNKLRLSLKRMARVDACPEKLTTITEASTRLGCGKDEYGNDQYICLPTVDLSSLVEFCYNGIMGYYKKGTCML